MTVPTVGIFKYAGVTFPAETDTNVVARPRYDESDRTITHLVHAITAKTTITAACLIDFLDPEITDINSGDPTDDIMDVIKQRLTTEGSTLVFEGMGFGSLSCNGGQEDADGNEIIDVDFGPKPRLAKWKPIGNTAVEIEWLCEVNLPTCFGLLYQGVLLSFTYTQDFNVDHLGHCSRTTTGSISIPLNRTQDGSQDGQTTLPDTADEYWEDTFNRFLIPYWCRRTTNQRYLNYAKNALRFRIVDTQMGQNMLPPNVSDMQASQSVSPVHKEGQQSITCTYLITFNATITMGRGVPRYGCYQVFLNWIRERLNVSLSAGFTMMPISINLAEPDVFGTGPTGTISMAFLMLQPLSASNANTWLTGTGMWLPSSNAYEDWISSMASNEVNTAFGSAGLRANQDDDELVDVCNQPVSTYGSDFIFIDMPFGPGLARIPVIKPTPEGSWCTWQNKLASYAAPGTVLHKLLPVIATLPATGLGGIINYAAEVTGTTLASLVGAYDGSSDTDVVQTTKSPTMIVNLKGTATRAAYDIPMPKLLAFNGDEISPMGTPFFETEQIANFGFKITRGTWDISYLIPYSENLSSYQVVSPDSPLAGQDVNDSDDTSDELEGYGIDDSGEALDTYEELS